MTGTASAGSVAEIQYILLYGTLRLGGIETLIVRLANHLADQGRKVLVCYQESGPLLSALSSRVHTTCFSTTSEIREAARVSGILASKLTAIVSFDPISAAQGLKLQLDLSKRGSTHHVSGVFHPRAYFMTGERADRVLLNKLVARAVGWPSLFFMNLDCRSSHADRWREDLRSSRIIKLPVGEAEGEWHPAKGATVRVVSIGRLVDFKGYNLGAAGIVAHCRVSNVAVTWDIYGTGPLEPEIRQEIERHAVGAEVRLRGELPYDRLRSTVRGYDLFIGVGTAALEAAMEGVPTLCATDTEPRLCYGYLHELPLGNIGELQADPPTRDFADVLVQYAELGEDERASLSRLSRLAAQNYSMPEFVRSLDKLILAPCAGRTVLRYIASAVYQAATNSRAVKIFRSMRRQTAKV